jgi:hypothetical protein
LQALVLIEPLKSICALGGGQITTGPSGAVPKLSHGAAPSSGASWPGWASTSGVQVSSGPERHTPPMHARLPEQGVPPGSHAIAHAVSVAGR